MVSKMLKTQQANRPKKQSLGIKFWGSVFYCEHYPNNYENNNYITLSKRKGFDLNSFPILVSGPWPL
jgi:hypothetical protein